MQRPYNDRWERTRRYLLRNLFDYHGDLSPIPEESRSDSSDDRPYSPLPDLVVEREPNRHDHNKEYYEGLTVRMRRYYKRLFIDGVSEQEELLNDADDISEFEINQSMASTFIIDTNNRIDDEERHMLIEDESRLQFDSIIDVDKIPEVSKTIQTHSIYLSVDEKSDAKNVTNEKEECSGIQESSDKVSTLLDVPTNEDEFEVNGAVNKTQETQAPDKEASKSIDTDPDLQSYHRTSTTVAQVHGEVDRVKAPRVFEDGSPVLMPKAHELSRRVFGNLTLNVRSIMSSINDDKREGEGIEGYDENTQVSKEIQNLNQSKINDEVSDLEVEWLMKSADSVSNESQGLVETCEEEESSEDIEQNQTSESSSVELLAFDDEDHKALEDENGSPLITSESDEMIQTQDEESIGPNEFDCIELSPKAKHSETHVEESLELVENSFEMAIRKGLFVSKNARKTAVPSSDEELDDDSYEFEPVEVMRGTMQTRLTETLRRESTISKDSPPVAKFATQATAKELEEDNSERDDSQINASDAAVIAETRDEDDDRHFQRELTNSQDSSDTDALGIQDAAEEFGSSDHFEWIDAPVDKENETSEVAGTDTPCVKRIRGITDVCDDIWSVSPVKINFEELPPKGHDKELDEVPPSSLGHIDLTSSFRTNSSQKKRASDSDSDVNAPMNKKKRFCDIAIQTGASKELNGNWYSVKNNFFVGKPLVLRVCSCQNHVCARDFS